MLKGMRITAKSPIVSKNNHINESLAATANIDNFGHGQFADTTEDRGENHDDCQQAVVREGRGYVGRKNALDRLKEGVNEANQVETEITAITHFQSLDISRIRTEQRPSTSQLVTRLEL